MRFSLLFLLSGAVLAASLFFGGGTQRAVAADLAPQLLALILIVMAAPAAFPALRSNRLMAASLISVIMVPVVHLVPMPPAIWGALPGRDQFLEAYRIAGVEAPWLPLALRPGEALRSGFALLPGVALFLAVLSLDGEERKRLVAIALVIGLVGACLAILQVLGGRDGPLYFHAVTNAGRGVGFFANANHAAALLYACIPFAAALLVRRTRAGGAPLWMFGACVLVAFILALALTGSRTALLLGLASLAASAAWVARDTVRALMRERGALWGVAALALVVTPAAMGMGLLAILDRFGADGLAEMRWTIYEHALAVTREYWPFGAGLGSFVRAYQWDEPVDTVSAQFVNQAHNDWLQIVLETGVLGLCAAGVFAAWFVRTLATKFEADESAQRLRKASILVILLLGAHSLWDYPLRTVALSAMFGLACALTRPPAAASTSTGATRRSRSHAR